MTFAEELRGISANTSFEEQMWQEIKKTLILIAKDGHPNGCYVKITGAIKNFRFALEKIAQKDDVEYIYWYTLKDGTHVALVYWEVRNEENKEFTNISDCLVSVNVTEERNIVVTKEPLEEKLNNAEKDLINDMVEQKKATFIK